MFDLTKEVQLNPLWQKRYSRLRGLLLLSFLIAGFLFVFHIILPTQDLSLSLTEPVNRNNNLIFDGKTDDVNLFSAYSAENFSTATFQIILDKKSPALQGQKIYVRKTYKAFADPTGSFLNDFPTTADSGGSDFSNGTLLSFGNSIFAVVDGRVLPFDNPFTFLSLGYSWDSVIPVTSDEIGSYQRDKLFTINRPHPNGTIFLTRDSQKYFLIKNGQKLEIPDPKILGPKSPAPIAVDEKSLDFNLYCELSKNLWPLRTYSCSVPIESLAKFLGNDYQFQVANVDPKTIRQVNLIFSRSLSWSNIRDTLSDIKHKALVNYGLAAPY